MFISPMPQAQEADADVLHQLAAAQTQASALQAERNALQQRVAFLEAELAERNRAIAEATAAAAAGALRAAHVLSLRCCLCDFTVAQQGHRRGGGRYRRVTLP